MRDTSLRDTSLFVDAWTALALSCGLAILALAARYVFPKARPLVLGIGLQAASSLTFGATIATAVTLRSAPIAFVGIAAACAAMITASMLLVWKCFGMLLRR